MQSMMWSMGRCQACLHTALHSRLYHLSLPRAPAPHPRLHAQRLQRRHVMAALLLAGPVQLQCSDRCTTPTPPYVRVLSSQSPSSPSPSSPSSPAAATPAHAPSSPPAAQPSSAPPPAAHPASAPPAASPPSPPPVTQTFYTTVRSLFRLKTLLTPSSPTNAAGHHQERVHTAGQVSVDTQNRTLVLAFLGNVSICALKLWAYFATSSSAMFAEFIHTLVDTLNQALLLYGGVQAARGPDRKHPQGYGRAAFFFSLVSALNVYWLGCVFTSLHVFYDAFYHVHTGIDMTWHSWLVLLLSGLIDGLVLKTALTSFNASRPPNTSLWSHLKRAKNPLVMSTILEDAAAVTGVVLATTGIMLTNYTNNILFDYAASLSVAGLLAFIAYRLVRMNYKFLLGYSVDPRIVAHIRSMIERRATIQHIYAVHSEWLSPTTFAYRCEIDFDGTVLCERLESVYRPMFVRWMRTQQIIAQQQALSDNATRHSISGQQQGDTSNDPMGLGMAVPPLPSSAPSLGQDEQDELVEIMAAFAEDVTRLVEEEVMSLEQEIRSVYPEAAYIELEPASHVSSDVKSAALLNLYKKRKHKGRADLDGMGMAGPEGAVAEEAGGAEEGRKPEGQQKERQT